MKVGIMQPYFFPYLGYFSLIKQVDLFVLLDDVQFIRHGWIDRNRILKPLDGWQYISCPLRKHQRDSLIKNIEIRNEEDWQQKIFAQLIHYKKKSKHYDKTIDLIREIFSIEVSSISEFNKVSLEKVCKFIGINTKIINYKELNIFIEPPNEPDEWALNICLALGNVKEYINPIGGQSFFNIAKYKQNEIKLKFHKYNSTIYPQKGNMFEPGLSIIDVLMFNTPDEIQKHLDCYELS